MASENYKAVFIPSDETPRQRSESSSPSQPDVQVTRDMVLDPMCDDLWFDMDTVTYFSAPTPHVSLAADPFDTLSEEVQDGELAVDPIEGFHIQLMVVYAQGDVNSAIHCLAESLNNPFKKNAVATVLVEECLLKDFIGRVRGKMRPLGVRVTCHPKYRNTLDILATMKVGTVVADEEHVKSPELSPIIVLNCTHDPFGGFPSGVLNLLTFRSTIEVVQIIRKQNLQYETASIWNESVEGLYQLVASLECRTFYFNCFNVDLAPIATAQAEDKIHVRIFDGFHYETLQVEDQEKVVVFPITACLTQKAEEPGMDMISPILMLS